MMTDEELIAALRRDAKHIETVFGLKTPYQTVVAARLEALTQPSVKVSDEQVERACRAFLTVYGDPAAKWFDYEKEIRAALEAAQLPARPVVKALEWEDLGGGKSFRAYLPIIGSVRVEPYGVCGWWEVLWSMPGQCDKLIPDVFDNPNEAKAAAQADYERRILSALEGEDHE